MRSLSLSDGNWARVKTKVGGVMGRVYTGRVCRRVWCGFHMVGDARVERGLEKMAGMWDFCDARITTDDDPELIDIEQGIPHMKGVPCAVQKLDPDQVERLEREYSEANELMRGPEGKMLKSKSKSDDFMFDDFTGDGLEFEAVELSLYGRNTK